MMFKSGGAFVCRARTPFKKGDVMAQYVLKRLVSMVCVLLAMILFIFTLMYFVPGDPATIMLGESATPEAIQAIHDEFGLDDPFIVQLGRYVGNLFRGDMGISYRSRNPVFPLRLLLPSARPSWVR